MHGTEIEQANSFTKLKFKYKCYVLNQKEEIYIEWEQTYRGEIYEKRQHLSMFVLNCEWQRLGIKCKFEETPLRSKEKKREWTRITPNANK